MHTHLSTRFACNSHVIRSNSPLTDEQIRFVAPSVYASEQHSSRSDRYSYIPTNVILDGLREQGFQPFMACQTRTRNVDNHEFTKHMLRLRHASQICGDEANEIILINSHNGTSSYQMFAGVLRFVCSNGLVVGSDIADYRVPHVGDVKDRVIEGAFEVLERFENVDGNRDTMKSLTLSDGQQRAFAEAALTLRYDDIDKSPVSNDSVLRPRRSEDMGRDLWTVFNRVQENIVKGGLHGRNEERKRVTTRPVNGMDSNIKLNRALWVLADAMAKLTH